MIDTEKKHRQHRAALWRESITRHAASVINGKTEAAQIRALGRLMGEFLCVERPGKGRATFLLSYRRPG